MLVSLMLVSAHPAAADNHAVASAVTTINFDDLPHNTLVTNQYPAATFSSPGPGDPGIIRARADVDAISPPNVMCSASASGLGNCEKDVAVSFTTPVDALRFYAIAVHDTDAGVVRVYENGSLSATVPIIGQGDPLKPLHIDLSAYHNVTKIVMEPWQIGGILWDDFTFVAQDGEPEPEPEPCADPGPDEVVIYEHADYKGRCVLKGIGHYDNADSFAPLPDNSASSIRVGDDVTAVLASDTGLGGDSEKFTGDDPDFSDNGSLDNGTSSFKVQRRASSDYWSVTLSTAGKPKHWIGDVGIVVSARLRTVRSGRVEGVPNRPLSFDFRSQSTTGASGMKCVPADCLTNAVGVVAWRYDAKNPGVDQIVAYYDEDANGTYDAGEPHAVSSVEWSYARYLALGDSFSSGEGIPAYEPGTDIDGTNECHRSIWQPRGFPGSRVWTGAYSGFISRELRLAEGGRLGFHACSGAVIANVLRDSQWEGELPQLDHVKEQRPDLITITIGGNDAGFGMVLDACVTSGLIGVPCNPSLDGSVRQAIADMNLKDVYVALKQAAPDARVIILGYPHLFQTPSKRYCYVLAEDANWMNAMTDELNAKIRRSISDANQELADNKISGVEYASQTDAFRGHELCTDREWVIDPIHAGGSVASFHPEPAGQQALAIKLWSTITGN